MKLEEGSFLRKLLAKEEEHRRKKEGALEMIEFDRETKEESRRQISERELQQ